MKHFLLTIFVTVTALTLSAQAHWLGKVHDFGAFDEDMGVVTCEFRVVNDGTEPLVILGARANCGCTRPSFTREPVAPGDTAVITVGYDPKGRPGKFTKNVYVDTNTEPTRTTLEITGTVIGASNTLKSRYPVDAGPMKLRGKTIAYGQILKDRTAGKYLEGYNASADTLRPEVSGAPRHISVIVEPKVVPPGQQFVISTIFHSEMTPDWGISTASFDLRPSSGAEPLTVETVAIIREDFSGLTPTQMDNKPIATVSESRIDFGNLSRDSAPVSRTFTITNSGHDPLIIRQISCPDKAVTIKCKETKIKKGKSAKVTVTVNPAAIGDAELLNARITITVNDPVNPTEMVRLTGIMR